MNQCLKLLRKDLGYDLEFQRNFDKTVKIIKTTSTRTHILALLSWVTKAGFLLWEQQQQEMNELASQKKPRERLSSAWLRSNIQPAMG